MLLQIDTYNTTRQPVQPLPFLLRPFGLALRQLRHNCERMWKKRSRALLTTRESGSRNFSKTLTHSDQVSSLVSLVFIGNLVLSLVVHVLIIHNKRFCCCIAGLAETQFHRCMDQHLGIPLSDEAYQFLAQKYDTKSNGMFNYRLFIEALESGTNNCIFLTLSHCAQYESVCTLHERSLIETH